MKNTVIITEDGTGINAKDFWGYALQQYHQSADYDDVGYGTIEESSGLELIACGENKEDNILICSVKCSIEDDYIRVTHILSSLLAAVKNNERIWDVKENVDYAIPF